MRSDMLKTAQYGWLTARRAMTKQTGAVRGQGIFHVIPNSSPLLRRQMARLGGLSTAHWAAALKSHFLISPGGVTEKTLPAGAPMIMPILTTSPTDTARISAM